MKPAFFDDQRYAVGIVHIAVLTAAYDNLLVFPRIPVPFYPCLECSFSFNNRHSYTHIIIIAVDP